MAKLTLSDLSSLANETSAINTINNNNAAIETAIENTLSRDGTSPNSMNADLDMNNNDILNVATLNVGTLLVDGVAIPSVQDITILSVTSRTALKAIDTSACTTALLSESGREGLFYFRSGDYSTQVTADTVEAVYIKADDTATTSGVWVRDMDVDGKVSASWAGMVGDYNGTTGTDNLSAWNGFLSFIQATGFTGFVPGGSYWFSDNPTALGDGDVIVEGDNFDTHFYVGGSGTFFKVVQTNAFNKTIFRGFDLIAWSSSARGALAIDVQYPSTASFTLSQGEIDVMIRGDTGAVSPFYKNWESAVSIKNGWNFKLGGEWQGAADIYSGADLVGRQDESFALRIEGGSYGSVGAELNKVVATYFDHGVLCDAYTEAMRFDNCDFVGVTKGISVPNTTALGGASSASRALNFWFDNTHFATFETGFNFDTVYIAEGDVNIQRFNGSAYASDWRALDLTTCGYFANLVANIGGNTGTGDAVALYTSAGGSMSITMFTSNVDKLYDITSTVYSHFFFQDSGTSSTPYTASTLAGTNTATVIHQILSDGNFKVGNLIVGGTYSSSPGISANDYSVTDKDLVLSSQGAGAVNIMDSIGTNIIGRAVRAEASPAEYVQLMAYATGHGAEVTAGGTATDISLRIRPKNAGKFLMEFLASRSYANDTAAQAGGIAIGEVYLNSSTGALTLRVT